MTEQHLSPDNQQGVREAALACADELIAICEGGQRLAQRTGNTFVLDRQRVAGFIAGRFTSLAALAQSPANRGETWRDVIKQPDERWLPTYGQIPWDQLGRDVNDAIYATRRDYEFDPSYYPGHQMLPALNFNSLARIVDKYRYNGLPCAPNTPESAGPKSEGDTHQLKAGEEWIDGKLYGWTGRAHAACKGTGEDHSEQNWPSETCRGCGGTGDEWGLMPVQPGVREARTRLQEIIDLDSHGRYGRLAREADAILSALSEGAGEEKT